MTFGRRGTGSKILSWWPTPSPPGYHFEGAGQLSLGPSPSTIFQRLWSHSILLMLNLLAGYTLSHPMAVKFEGVFMSGGGHQLVSHSTKNPVAPAIKTLIAFCSL